VNLKVIWQLLSATYTEWTEDHAQGLGAALAFYAVFSLAPLLLIVIAIAGAVFGQEELFAREWRQLWDVL
jgi:membrane protein